VLLAVVGLVLCFSLWGGAKGVIAGFKPLPDDNRVLASRWIEQNISAGSSVVLEGFLPHYLPHVFSSDAKTELTGLNYLLPPLVKNELLVAGFSHYMTETASVSKPFQVRIMDETMAAQYDPRALSVKAGDYMVISERIYKRFYQEHFKRQSPQLARNAQGFYRFIRDQEPVQRFEGRGPTIEIYRVRPQPAPSP